MLSSRLFDSVERVCRAMKRSEEPFGKPASDFCRAIFSNCLRFRAQGGETEFIHKSEAWKKMDARVMLFGRAVSAQRCFFGKKFLNEMRSGSVSPATRGGFWEKAGLPVRQAGGKCLSDSVVPTRLYTHNVDVDAENERELEKIPGKRRAYEMSSKREIALRAFAQEGILAPETLRLKEKSGGDVYKNALLTKGMSTARSA